MFLFKMYFFIHYTLTETLQNKNSNWSLFCKTYCSGLFVTLPGGGAFSVSEVEMYGRTHKPIIFQCLHVKTDDRIIYLKQKLENLAPGPSVAQVHGRQLVLHWPPGHTQAMGEVWAQKKQILHREKQGNYITAKCGCVFLSKY